MASRSGAIRAGRAFVELFTENSRFIRGLNQAKKQLQAFSAFASGVGRRLVAVGGAMLGALGGALFSFARSGDELNKMAARTGVAVESLSRLRFAAEQSGSEVEALEAGVRTMQRSILDLSRGTTTAVENFGALGLTWADLDGLSPEDQFTVIAQRVSEISDPTMQAALAMRVFGRNGTALLPMLSQGAAGIRTLADEADRLGIVMSTEQAQAAADFSDAWNRITEQLKAAVVQVGGALAPALTALSHKFTPVLSQWIDWIKQNSGLVISLGKLSVAVVAVGAALIATGTAAGALASVLGLVTGAIAVLMSPMGAMVGTAALVTAAIGHFTGALEDAKREIGALSTEMSQSWSAIKNLIMAGDVENAIRVVVATMKLLWHEMLDDLKNAWNKFWHDDSFDVTLEFNGEPIRVWRREATQTFDEVSDATRAAREELDRLQMLGAKAGNADNPLADAVRTRITIDQNAAAIGQLFTPLSPFRGGLPRGGLGEFDPEFIDLLNEQEQLKGKGPKFSGTKDVAKSLDTNLSLASEGTFSAFQATSFGFGATDEESRTARATEETARHTRDAARLLRDGAVFT